MARQPYSDAGKPASDAVGGGSPDSDAELVARAQKGSEWAADQLVRRYRKKAFAIAYRMCDGDREAAADVTQDVFFSVFRNLKQFRRQSSFYTWFYRILINRCIDARRRKRRWFSALLPRKTAVGKEPGDAFGVESIADTSGRADPLEELQGKELGEQVSKAMEKLSNQQKIAFQLKVHQELSIAEIARVMGTAEGTVKSHLFRAMKTLRETLGM